MELIVSLITAHLIGDFVLQNNFLAQNKGKNKLILFVHSWLWCVSIVLAFILNGISINIIDFMFLFLMHAYIDNWKCKQPKEKMGMLLWFDQAIHLFQIAMVLLNKIR